MKELLQDRVKQARAKHEQNIKLSIEEAERLIMQLQDRRSPAQFRATRYDDTNDHSNR